MNDGGGLSREFYLGDLTRVSDDTNKRFDQAYDPETTNEP